MTYNWAEIERRRAAGETWTTIAPDFDTTPGTLRKAYSRYLGNAADSPGELKREGRGPNTLAAGASPAPSSPGMRILGIDIETAPNQAFTWGIWKQDIRLDQLIQASRALCFAYRWFSDGPHAETAFVSEYRDGHEEMVREAWRLLDEADAVVHYNGSKFDLPVLNREFLKYGLTPPSTYAEVDLLRTARRRFRFQSNKLDHLLKDLGLGEKVRHPGFTMWVRCMNGDPDAWADMEEYNRADVEQMEKLYHRMLPWISNHPNHALYRATDRPTCTNCGGTRLQSRGTTKTKTQMYRRFQCQECGTWLRERFTSVDRDKRRHVLTQA